MKIATPLSLDSWTYKDSNCDVDSSQVERFIYPPEPSSHLTSEDNKTSLVKSYAGTLR